jgi:hypothetical protein
MVTIPADERARAVTISELIACLERRLAKYGDREIIVTWETTEHTLDPDGVFGGNTSQRDDDPPRPVLFIDGDACAYKIQQAHDPTEGDDGL